MRIWTDWFESDSQIILRWERPVSELACGQEEEQENLGLDRPSLNVLEFNVHKTAQILIVFSATPLFWESNKIGKALCVSLKLSIKYVLSFSN